MNITGKAIYDAAQASGQVTVHLHNPQSTIQKFLRTYIWILE